MKAVALVTGASSGIGAATAEALVAAGWGVIAAARRADRLAALAARLGPACHAAALDVTRDQSVAALLAGLPASFRTIDLLVNNAGHDVGGRRRFDEGDLAEWQAIVDTNLAGMIRVTHAVVPAMLARRRGHIVNVGSVAGRTGFAGLSIYAATKFAVHGFSDSLRKDFRGQGVRVSEILPGLVRTEFAATRWKGDAAKADSFYAAGKGTLAPADIARAIVYCVEQPPEVTVAEMTIVPTGDLDERAAS